ncbi:hypothetical protein [Burkholderia sp. TSV86]|uniref:hypothetical protein n=1 Tax=Burkholderia sp. TSV86 TaxID=1385594 RepID=UPI000756062D|nr:hypothetical protein [Burkholderia sp. TSV86]KVE35376.1 hypothetical protein WS68_07490 [Burkholderia sp. TSV86]
MAAAADGGRLRVKISMTLEAGAASMRPLSQRLSAAGLAYRSVQALIAAAPTSRPTLCAASNVEEMR